jgi:hypothetical protein
MGKLYGVAFGAIVDSASHGFHITLVGGWMEAVLSESEHLLASLYGLVQCCMIMRCTTYLTNLVLRRCGLPFEEDNVNDGHFDK